MRENDLTFTGVVLKDENAFASLCLELDIASQGETVMEAKNALAEATALYLETAIENNLSYLRPVPREDDPRYTLPSEIIETFPLRVNIKVRAYA
ncbi:MAG: hypothetical protein EYC68_08460 [Chloroflexota bacterium]|nr:MAG: hypothetical protein EYC68_08460 [Chloroflexota bacterium]